MNRWNASSTATLSHETRYPAPVALSNTMICGATPIYSNTRRSPSHTHSAFFPGRTTA